MLQMLKVLLLLRLLLLLLMLLLLLLPSCSAAGAQGGTDSLHHCRRHQESSGSKDRSKPKRGAHELDAAYLLCNGKEVHTHVC
jgi:hypothetical protein